MSGYDDYDDELTPEDLEKALGLIDSLKFDSSLIESETCTACSGSGRYDSKGSPKCGACGGRGRAPSSENAVRRLSQDLSTLNDLDWREARVANKSIQAHMESIGLGWEDVYYWG